jgi:hypothetical protein
MKTQIAKPAMTTGSVLLVTLVTVVIIGVTLTSYLALVSNQSRSVARSQIWNNAMAVTEAGVEDGLQLVNKYVGTPDLGSWTTTYSADGWKWPVGGNTYQLTRYMDTARTTYYNVFITNINNAPIIHSVGYVPGPSWVAGTPPMSRTVEVSTKIDAMFNVCMAALGTIDLKGNGIATDSFDSSDPNYSTNGLYTPLRRKAGGDIVTNNTITNSVLSVANGDIAGHVTTGPNGSITIGPNGTVGDLAWVSSSFGIEPGWSGNDLNVVFKDVVLPNVSWSLASGAGTGGSGMAPDGNNYAHVFTSPLDSSTTPGNYTIPDSGDIYVGTNVSVRLNITHPNFSPNNIYVAGVTTAEAGKMIGYLNGPPGQSATLGTTDMTQSGKAANLAFLGLPNCTSLSYKGNGDFTGVIYAPEAAFQLAGGGSGIIDFIGSSVTKTVQMNGHYHFHYDENLKKTGPNNGYVATLWREY